MLSPVVYFARMIWILIPCEKGRPFLNSGILIGSSTSKYGLSISGILSCEGLFLSQIFSYLELTQKQMFLLGIEYTSYGNLNTAPRSQE